MPELPDVEAFKRYMDATSLHQKIRFVEVRNEKILGDVSARTLQSTLKGRTFESTRRHGKNLFAGLDGGGWMLMHFGMTGRLAYFKDLDEEPLHSRLLFAFENDNHLAFVCQRMFGKVELVEGPKEFVREKELSPDALDLDSDSFRERLKGTRGRVKATLMNQKILAGIGNVYSDEILFQARLHPETSVAHLDGSTLEELHKEIRRVLETAIEREADPHKLPVLLPALSQARGREVHAGPRQDPEDQSPGRTAYYLACMTNQGEVIRKWPGKRNGRSSRNDLSRGSARSRCSGKVLSTPGSP